jgi:hypothetical protein
MPLDNSPVAIERKKKVTKCEACFYPSIKCDLNSVYGQVVLPLRFLMLSMLDNKQVSTSNKTNPVTSSTLGVLFVNQGKPSHLSWSCFGYRFNSPSRVGFRFACVREYLQLNKAAQGLDDPIVQLITESSLDITQCSFSRAN